MPLSYPVLNNKKRTDSRREVNIWGEGKAITPVNTSSWRVAICECEEKNKENKVYLCRVMES